MEKLTYKLIYNPESFTSDEEMSSIDFTCYDNKIHLRLRDFNDDEVIKGYINKMTFLVTYITSVLLEENKEKYFSLKDSEVIKLINEQVNDYLKDFYADIIPGWAKWGYRRKSNFKGILISKNYRKKKHSYFGSISNDLIIKNTRLDLGQNSILNVIWNLTDYLNMSGIKEFLTNDAYELVICKSDLKRKNSSYKKFINKNSKKIKNESEFVPLW